MNGVYFYPLSACVCVRAVLAHQGCSDCNPAVRPDGGVLQSRGVCHNPPSSQVQPTAACTGGVREGSCASIKDEKCALL